MGVILHFQSSGTVPGQGAPVRMTGSALTIGRGPENDLCLPDPAKVISKNHCTIENHGDRYFVIDLSTNGTYLNYAKEPLGPVSTPLNDGDVLVLGSYELMVEITSSDEAAAPSAPSTPDPAPPPATGGLDDLVPPGGDEGDDFLDDLLGGGASPVGPSSVARHEPGDDGLLPPLGEEDDLLAPLPETEPPASGAAFHGDAVHDAFTPQVPAGQPSVTQPIPDDWDDELLLPGATPEPPEIGDPFAGQSDDGPAPGPEAMQPPMPEAPDTGDWQATPEHPPASAADPDPAPAPAPPPPPGDAAARAFLAALGADEVNIPDDELEETMARLGAVMATMITGLREILMTRASIKSEFRIQQTVIGAGGNNPLKFSISPEQAIEAMVRPARGYLPAREAAEEALNDIKAHEVAMMTAMEAALKGLLKQLSPEMLEAQLTTGGGISGLLQGRKARYWDVYESMYARISDQAETDFQDLFGRAFARAYQDQMDRLK